ncbi:MAG TPA: hypothetical protein VJ739_16525 [Gemmataceae bacterium]|nr:hypothetical protein [Gemmataceae bacterium]
MRLRYFVVDACGQARRVTPRAVQDLWEGRHGADALGCPTGNELRLVSVVCNGRLQPRKLYLLRLPLTDGRFTPENYLTLRIFARPDCVTPREAFEHHSEGWPGDLFVQLAVALDVPVARLHVPLAVGGPLFLAAAMQVSPRQALRYLR